MRFRGIFSIFVAVLFSGFPMHAGDSAAEAMSQVVKVRGANTTATIVNGWANAFSEANPSSRAVVSGGGTTAAFESLFDKGCQLVMATRSINEKELQAAALSGSKPASVEVCRECLAIITHPDNPVNALTLEQLRGIFTGDLTGWQEVGGPNEPILVITGDQTSGAALLLRHAVMEDGYFTGDARTKEFYTDIVRDVSRSKPRAISYAGLTDAKKAEQGKLIKILGLRKNQDSQPVLPDIESLRNGGYPLVMSLSLYWDELSPVAATRQFVEFCKKQCPTR